MIKKKKKDLVGAGAVVEEVLLDEGDVGRESSFSGLSKKVRNISDVAKTECLVTRCKNINSSFLRFCINCTSNLFCVIVLSGSGGTIIPL